MSTLKTINKRKKLDPNQQQTLIKINIQLPVKSLIAQLWEQIFEPKKLFKNSDFLHNLFAHSQ